MSTPHTDWLESHPTPLMGRHYTQTYFGMPRTTTFRSAWENERTVARDRILAAAELIVSMEKARPLKFYSEDVTPYGKMGAWDHGHVGTSTLADIAVLLADEFGAESTAEAARDRMMKVMVEYGLQKNSWLVDTHATYGTTGRCRISAMILRALLDTIRVASLKGHENVNVLLLALNLLRGHLSNVLVRWPLHDGPQGDGLMLDHWRAFQVGILAHACHEIAMTPMMRADITADAIELAGRCVPIMAASVARTDADQPYGFYYDVPHPVVPQPWTDLPGYKLGSGNGVEPWLYAFLPDDAQARILSVNKNLHPAVRAKFGMP